MNTIRCIACGEELDEYYLENDTTCPYCNYDRVEDPDNILLRKNTHPNHKETWNGDDRRERC